MATLALPCFRKIFTDLINDDGLVVLAKGLGIRVLLCRFIKFYADVPNLVFVINCTNEVEILHDILHRDGVPINRLPPVVTSSVSVADRRRIYMNGGVVIISPQIILADLLTSRIDARNISGFLVANAHQVGENSKEGFAIRNFKQKNPTGFIKAFSDEAETLSSGFGRLEKTMRALHIKKLFLWPRFHSLISRDLDAQKPDVNVEYSLSLTPKMIALQRALLSCYEDCFHALRQLCSFDQKDLNLEDGLFQAFDVTIRQHLQESGVPITPFIRSVLLEIRTIRNVLQYLLYYDPVTFYSYLQSMKMSIIQERASSAAGVVDRNGSSKGYSGSDGPNRSGEWLLSPSGEEVLRIAKSRVYECVEVTDDPPTRPPPSAAGALSRIPGVQKRGGGNKQGKKQYVGKNKRNGEENTEEGTGEEFFTPHTGRKTPLVEGVESLDPGSSLSVRICDPDTYLTYQKPSTRSNVHLAKTPPVGGAVTHIPPTPVIAPSNPPSTQPPSANPSQKTNMVVITPLATPARTPASTQHYSPPVAPYLQTPSTLVPEPSKRKPKPPIVKLGIVDAAKKNEKKTTNEYAFLRTTFDIPPKWEALTSALKEVATHWREWRSNARLSLPSEGVSSRSDSSALGRINKTPVTVLVLCKDERTCNQLRLVLTYGPMGVITQTYQRYLFRNAMRSRVIRNLIWKSYAPLLEFVHEKLSAHAQVEDIPLAPLKELILPNGSTFVLGSISSLPSWIASCLNLPLLERHFLLSAELPSIPVSIHPPEPSNAVSSPVPDEGVSSPALTQSSTPAALPTSTPAASATASQGTLNPPFPATTGSQAAAALVSAGTGGNAPGASSVSGASLSGTNPSGAGTRAVVTPPNLASAEQRLLWKALARELRMESMHSLETMEEIYRPDEWHEVIGDIQEGKLFAMSMRQTQTGQRPDEHQTASLESSQDALNPSLSKSQRTPARANSVNAAAASKENAIIQSDIADNPDVAFTSMNESVSSAYSLREQLSTSMMHSELEILSSQDDRDSSASQAPLYNTVFTTHPDAEEDKQVESGGKVGGKPIETNTTRKPEATPIDLDDAMTESALESMDVASSASVGETEQKRGDGDTAETSRLDAQVPPSDDVEVIEIDDSSEEEIVDNEGSTVSVGKATQQEVAIIPIDSATQTAPSSSPLSTICSPITTPTSLTSPTSLAGSARGNISPLPNSLFSDPYLQPPLALPQHPCLAVQFYPISKLDLRPPLLPELDPYGVVLYDPDPQVIREVEVFACTRMLKARSIDAPEGLDDVQIQKEDGTSAMSSVAASHIHRPLWFCHFLYVPSSEQVSFYSAIRKERVAFESLIEKKAFFAPSVRPTSEKEFLAIMGGSDASLAVRRDRGKGAIDAWGIALDREGKGFGGGGLSSALEGMKSTSLGATLGVKRSRDGRSAVSSTPSSTDDEGTSIIAGDIPIPSVEADVIVDMRELKSSLPSLLDLHGLQISVHTIEVGDYVISADIAVERKSIPDLIGSLSSGRLYGQIEAMVRHYPVPILLIEVSDSMSKFSSLGDVVGNNLENSLGVLRKDISISDPRSRLVLLLLHFPQLRIVWSNSPLDTVHIIKRLKEGRRRPNLAHALAAGSTTADSATTANGQTPLLAQYPSYQSQNLPAIDLLRKLPGVTVGNYRELMERFRSLRGIAIAKEEELVAVMGKENGRTLYAFLHHRAGDHL